MTVTVTTTEISRSADEFETTAVPPQHRRSLASVAAVWAGFPMVLTCAVFGGLIVYSLGFVRGLAAIGVGNLCLMVYVGSLSALAGRTGENFAQTAARTFGRRAAAIPAAFLASIVIGWFAFQTGMAGAILHDRLGWHEQLTTLVAGLIFVGLTLLGIRALAVIGMIAAPLYVALGTVAICLAARHGPVAPLSYPGGAGSAALSFGAAVTLVIASFIDSGTMTADFTRWSRTGRHGALAAFAAFPVGNSIALLIGGLVVACGGARDPGTDGGNFLGLLIDRGGVLVPLAVVFVFVNLGSVCAHCLYNGAVGWSQLTAGRMRAFTLGLGAIGIVAAVAGIWTYFEQWLNLLGVIVPPIGAVIIVDQLILGRIRRRDSEIGAAARRPPFIGWGAGAGAALLTHYTAPWLSDAVVGFAVAALVCALTHVLTERFAAEETA
ncbi:cytosine permease [Nocardia spumae]|uniref:cytosine permease n=1 Tax=Nocardia spumae TaxID=2887190 RepID=UPI001D15BD8E|nr:cytosine permease [Nocardia spumae]